ncbi:MAG: DUF5110 domain-containing protein [Bacteroidales bacterium]|nr:DUF5110 domain-containing protein [Bacteroidales bacterium]
MKRFLAILVAMAALLGARAQATGSNPVADSRAVVVKGHARFTVLTDRLIRMEWVEDGQFEDRATLGVVNRRMEVPHFTSQVKDKELTITTSRLTLRYKGDAPFDADNLSVAFRMKGQRIEWHPGADTSGNLLGTTRTLDGCEGFSKISYRDNYMDGGVLSRDGWAVVDESRRHLLVPDSSDWGEWVATRTNGRRQDLYLFAYGHDYTAALRDFTRLCGRIPMPPKYVFGYWWSRYWIYTDDEMLALAGEMRSRQIPIDVMIVDMDWHETWKPMNDRLGRDQFRQHRGWTGYTWNRDLFPDPAGFLDSLHRLHLKTALNLHPASGIQVYEDCYDRFVADYLHRTTDYDGPQGYVYGEKPYLFAGQSDTLQSGHLGYRAPVPFRIDQQAWADAYFGSVIHPLERQGVDFWWLDWQQWKYSRYTEGLNNTFWLNYTFFNDKVRRTKQMGLQAPRPFTYHRWGGLGSHRYPLGFSGDTFDDWEVLRFLPYFTATASNVGYGYWGHDIGGHMQHHDHPTDPEIYTRWLQYGVFTPIFKTHSTQSAMLDRRIWSYPTHYEYMKAAIQLRYALSPYIYTAAREAYDSGISICRPLYYSHPESPQAYSYNEEYLFGDRILATAVSQPADSATGLATRTLWFPTGSEWYDMATHTTYRGGTTRELHYTIAQNPWFVKSGSILPLAAEGIQNLQEHTNALRLLVVPGNAPSDYTLYEDDENTQAYTAGACAFTRIEKKSSSKRLTITVHPRQGTFNGVPTTRRLTILLEGTAQSPMEVRLNGKAVETTIRPGDPCISTQCLQVELPEVSVTAKNVVEILQK